MVLLHSHYVSIRSCTAAENACAGDGWSPRAEDAILHGCIPVVIQDNVDPVFATLLDWPSFSLRYKEVW